MSKRVLQSLRWACSLSALGALLCVLPEQARADEHGGGFFLDGFGSRGRIADKALHVPALATEPDPLKEKNLRLDGPGNLYGGGFHILLYGPHARGGLGIGFFGMENMRLRHDVLAQGLSASLGRQFGANFDLFVGRELLHGPVYPYVDLRTSFTVMQAGVVLHHDAYGDLGETPFNAYTFGLGPRLGVAVPLIDAVAIDISAYFGLFGAEQANLTMSFGFWDR